MELRIEPRRAALTLFAVAVTLLGAHFAVMYSRFVLHHGQLLGLVDTLNVNVENNVPTFFSAFLLFTCAVTLAVVARMPGNSAGDRRYWSGLGLIFLFLALDEDASIHELFINPLKYFLPDEGVLHFAWIVPYGILALVIGLLYLRFVLRLPEPTRSLTIAAGFVYLSGAFVFEMIGGWYISEVSRWQDFPYMTIVAGEEFLEMCGAILFLYTLLDRLQREFGGETLRIRFASA
jgi:hypothetical protein